jgi:hypothetical protein
MRLVAAATAVAFSTGCVSTTIIRSEPSGATVYIDGSKEGKTPFTYSDAKLMGATTRIKLKKPGYEDFETFMTRNEEFHPEVCAAGVFFLVPFLWVMGYKPERTFEMTPLQGAPAQQQQFMPQQPPTQPPPPTQQQQPLSPPPLPPATPGL